MRYFSTFSGIGGFELGIQQAYEIYNRVQQGQEGQGSEKTPETDSQYPARQHGDREQHRPVCIGYSEVDKYATQIYQRHFPNHKNYGDITKIHAKDLPDFDLLVGGFPCQAFSIAGKRGGFKDTRGTLFFDLARIIEEKQPRLLLLENVKGLLSHDKGATFLTIITALDELGYDCQWQVLNSKNHGVPQNRERVFIVGHSRGTPRPQVFPFGETDGEDNEPEQEKLGLRVTGNNKKSQRLIDVENAGALKSSNQTNIRSGGTTLIKQLNHPTHSNDRVYGEEGISPTLNTMQGGRRQPKVAIPVLTPDRPEKRQNGRRFKTNGEPAFTQTAQDRHGVSDGAKIRRLTPLECERLQGFPDGWTEAVSDTQRYKTLGNAVTVNVIKDIMGKLFATPNDK